MSELITVNPGTSTGPTLGLNIINEQPVRVFRETSTSPVVATGSLAGDTFQVASSTDTTSYVINADSGDDNVAGGAGADILSGAAGNDRISGGDNDDVIIGGIGNDQLQGGTGLDVIDAGLGDDTLSGDDGDDTLLGGPGNDSLFGGAGEDNLRGGDGRDILSGGEGNDVLEDGIRNDILIPGAGRDVMKGGAGTDTFRFTAGSTGSKQLDLIVDFSRSDKIELSRALLPGSGLKRGNLSREDFEVVKDLDSLGSTAKLVYEQKSGIVYYNPANGKDVPLFQLQANLSDINASNFRII